MALIDSLLEIIFIEHALLVVRQRWWRVGVVVKPNGRWQPDMLREGRSDIVQRPQSGGTPTK